MLTAVFAAIGYLSGSITWGYWLVRVFRHEDIRAQGSGNIGATNVWRVHGRKLGVPAVLLDTAKGLVPTLVATKIAGHDVGALTGAAAMAGHWRPLFLKFQKGGKMVATAAGAFLGLAPIVGGLSAAVWLLVFGATRYASVASIVSAAMLPFWSWLVGYPWPVTVFAAVAGLGVILLHRANIRRLLRGEENRFTRSRAAASP
jgi:acyl phosphate:glycerol-3-phosphate acyltransferase